MPCKKFSRDVYISLIKFWLNIHGRKGVHQNGFFIYFGGSKHLVCISEIIHCFLGPVLVIRYVISIIFFQIQWHFLSSKKGELGTFRLG